MRTKEEILKEIENTKHSFEFNTKFHQECLDNLQKELEELNKPKRFKPEFGKMYFFINLHGNVIECVWGSNHGDTFCYKTRNCFKTKEEAEEELERILFVNEVRDFIEEENGDWEPDWKDHNAKYFIAFVYDKISVEGTHSLQPTSKMIKSREIGEKILAKFDNQKLIKWWI